MEAFVAAVKSFFARVKAAIGRVIERIKAINNGY